MNTVPVVFWILDSYWIQLQLIRSCFPEKGVLSLEMEVSPEACKFYMGQRRNTVLYQSGTIFSIVFLFNF
jgi:hypothetical protein